MTNRAPFVILDNPGFKTGDTPTNLYVIPEALDPDHIFRVAAVTHDVPTDRTLVALDYSGRVTA